MYQITRNIWQGRFASPQRLSELQDAGITHILNVGESPNILMLDDGPFVRIDWKPIEDLVLVPTESAIECIQLVHDAVTEENSNLYIHCVAGWNRSPTILSLYLAACGLEPTYATAIITRNSYDAVPFHSQLTNKELIDAVIQYGLRQFKPHPRPNALEAAIVA